MRALFACLLVVAALPLVQPGVSSVTFSEGFEVGFSWDVFEEIVNGNAACYGDGLASVTVAPEAARTGAAGLRVHPNAAGSSLSNHVIVHHEAPEVPDRFAYVVHGRLPAATAATTQAGPELSVQETRESLPGVFLTQVAGFQYGANPHSDFPWHVWGQVGPAPGAWLPVHHERLQDDVWYRIELVVDWQLMRYESLRVTGGDTDVTIDLAHLATPVEAKGFDMEGVRVSVEAENLWSNCGSAGPFEAVVHYDDVRLVSLDAVPS